LIKIPSQKAAFASPLCDGDEGESSKTRLLKKKKMG